MERRSRGARRILLVGQGHAHLLLLAALAKRPLRGAEVTLLADGARAVYSGMVPGLVAGQYQEDEVTVPLAPLARRAGARLLQTRARRLSAAARTVETADGRLLPFDLASVDVGGSVAGLAVPGVRAHALLPRPMAGLMAALPELVARARAHGRGFRVLVVGAGAAGVELACAFRARLRREGVASPRITLLEAGPRILPGRPERVATMVARALHRLGIVVETGLRVIDVEPARVWLQDRSEREHDALVWCAGPAAGPFGRRSQLPCDPSGAIRVRATLEVAGVRGVFAVGDAASLQHAPDTPKAGVYAVRAAPVLEHNLRARLAGTPLRHFVPQRDFLALLNLGDGRAVAVKWGHAVSGRPLLWLKDRIDRRFVEQFPDAEPDQS